MRLNPINRDKLSKQFCGSEDLLSWAEYAEVRKLDSNVLSHIAREKSYDCSLGGYCNYDQWIVIALNDKNVPEGYILDMSTSGSNGRGHSWRSSASCIGMQILEREIDPSRIRFLLKKDFTDTDTIGNGEEVRLLEIYKWREDEWLKWFKKEEEFAETQFLETQIE
jgi:hypothetical protein